MARTQAQAEWDAWREDAKKMAEEPGPVKRRVPKSAEPPALVLMRDHFAVCLGLARCCCRRVLFGTFMFFVRGAMATPSLTASDGLTDSRLGRLRSHGSMIDLQGHSALITGSTKGVGRSIAEAFAAAGANVVIHGRSRDANAEEVLANCQSRGVQAEFVAGRPDGRDDSRRRSAVRRCDRRPAGHRHPRQQRRHVHRQAVPGNGLGDLRPHDAAERGQRRIS